VARRRITLTLGFVIGVLVVLTSVGAGAIGVAALMLIYPTLAVRRLIGTDVVHAIPLAFVAGLGHLALGSIDLKVLALLLLGSVPGIAAGARGTGARLGGAIGVGRRVAGSSGAIAAEVVGTVPILRRSSCRLLRRSPYATCSRMQPCRWRSHPV
jgi:uncharacterized membrane protein YfcA